MENKEISLDELKTHLDNLGKNEVILDVRRADEFKEGHIPGAINMTHDCVDEIADDLKRYDTIFIHCRAGGRAQKAFKTLSDLGFDNLVCISDAGFDAWQSRGYPVQKD